YLPRRESEVVWRRQNPSRDNAAFVNVAGEAAQVQRHLEPGDVSLGSGHDVWRTRLEARRLERRVVKRNRRWTEAGLEHRHPRIARQIDIERKLPMKIGKRNARPELVDV